MVVHPGDGEVSFARIRIVSNRERIGIMSTQQETLYSPQFEHDACGIGAVVNIDGRQTHQVVDNALHIVEN